jgi:hypothetical protein
MSPIDHAWLRYSDLQERSKKLNRIDDCYWGIDSALAYLLDAITRGTVPENPFDLDATLSRTITSGARLCRSRAVVLKTWISPPKSVPTSGAAEANIELLSIAQTVNRGDAKVLFDAGRGFTDREIAERHASTPGAIRARIYRLRCKLGKTRSRLPEAGEATSFYAFLGDAVASNRSESQTVRS